MTDYEPSVPPKPAPELRIPKSDATVKVSAIDTKASFEIPLSLALEPPVGGIETLTAPAFAFLVEHPSGKKSLFDLSIIKDLKEYPMKVQESHAKPGWKVQTEQDVLECLVEHGIKGEQINEIIWSHWHWDHIGAPWQFPLSTALVVGPGFKKEFLPGFPEDPDSRVPSKAWQNRELREISFDHGLQLGRFGAIDWYGDGSFYLLNTPGHAIGHICALARTTPTTFVFLGGDVCHHGGELRPTPWLPLPKHVTPSLTPKVSGSCPGSLWLDLKDDKSPVTPFYRMKSSFPSVYEDAEWSLEGTEEFDACEDVLVMMAHDTPMVQVVDFWPKSLNAWKEKGWGKRGKWAFLGDWKVEGPI